MELLFLAAAMILHVDVAMTGRGPHHPHAHYKPAPGSPKITNDQSLLHDTGHIQEDLGKAIKIEDINKMSPEELEFHYFKVHDYDNNTKLDGLEILQAIRHTVEHSESEDKSSEGKLKHTSPEDFNYFVELIDQVLEEDDHDRDGYLSYTEYVVGRQRDNNKKRG